MKIGARAQQRLLVFAAVLAPFTQLRFSFFGIAELIVFWFFCLQVFKPVGASALREFRLTKFWLVYILSCLLGYGWNVLFLDYKTGSFDLMVFDLASYLFVLFACFAMERMAIYGTLDMRRLLRQVFLHSSVVLGILYCISFFTPAIFGLRLRYYEFFSPLAENLHQVSMYLVPLPFLGTLVFALERRTLIRLFIAGLIVLDAIMAFSTGSTKAAMAIVIGCGVFGYAATLKLVGKRSFLPLTIAYMVLGSIVFLKLDGWQRIVAFFVENDGGGAREYLYSHAINLGMESFLVGHGPGGHIDYSGYGNFSDAHETFLTAFLQAGIVGLSALVLLIYRLLRQTMHNPSLLAALSTIVIYAAGGDVLRRLPVWIVLVIILHYPKQAVRQPVPDSRRRLVPVATFGSGGGGA